MTKRRTKSKAANAASPEYVIATVGDFLKVPEDRQADCLAEFADFLDVARGLVEITEIAGEMVGADATAQIGPFTWIDDGKKNRTILIHTHNAAVSGAAEPRTLDGLVGDIDRDYCLICRREILTESGHVCSSCANMAICVKPPHGADDASEGRP